MIQPSPFCEYERDVSDAKYYSPNRENACRAHFHRQLEFCYVLRGRYDAAINEDRRTLTANQIVFADSFDVHFFAPLDEEARSTVLIIPYRQLREFIRSKNHRSFRTNFITDPGKALSFLPFLELAGSYIEGHPLILNGIFGSILGLILANVPLEDTREAKNTEFSRSVLLWLEDHLAENISLRSISSHFGYSENHFSKLFHDCFRTNLNTYINSLRIQHAHKLISGGTPVLDAALDAGFSSLSTFYRSFKRQYGKNPTETLLAENS